ncbi:MAG: ribulose-phosphate 3-epimerase [Candidatus Daviesbacteria bacterium]|nr:ribulose-phosphate 3-epimerase [Candidatus Daviesbacteria bacterium]
MVQILPTIFAKTEEDYKKQIHQVELSGAFKDGWVQIDLMDNKFVPNLSIDLDIVAKYPINSRKEAQLMVAEPQNWIDRLAILGFVRIIFPIEIGNTDQLIEKITVHQIQVGLSINPDTDVDKLFEFLDKINLVLVMGVHPGFQGQKFIPETLDKIRKLADLKSKYNFLIGEDGGINPETVKGLVEAGVDNLAVGSYLFKGDINENLENLWGVING